MSKPAVSEVRKPRLRLAPAHDHVSFTRKAKGAKYQVRWHLSDFGSINCGLYDRELALVVRRELARETAYHAGTPLGVWAALCVVLARLRERGADVPAFVPPRYVYSHKDGSGYGARVRFGRAPHRWLIELPRPYHTPEEAHLAFVALLAAGEPAGT